MKKRNFKILGSVLALALVLGALAPTVEAGEIPDIIPERVAVKDPKAPEDVTPEVPEEPKVETPEEPEVPDSEGENSQEYGGLEDPSKPQKEKPAEPETPEKPQEAPTTPTKVEDKKVVGIVSTPSAPVAPESTVRAQTGGGVGFGLAGLLSSLVGAFTALKKRD